MPEPTRVEVTPSQIQLADDLRRVRALARLLDARFQFAGIHFGYDAIIGLLPVVGDTVTAGIALYPLYLAHRHGLGKLTLTRMAANVAIDWVVGAVPLLGDLLDVAWKSNLRNLSLFEQALDRRNRRAAPTVEHV